MISLRVARWTIAALTVAAVASLVSALAGSPWQASYALTGTTDAVTIGISVDVVRAILLCLVTGIGTVVAWYSSRNLTGQRRLTRFAVLEVLVVATLALAVATTSLLVLALAWTLASLALSGLVGHTGTPQARVAARQVRARLLVGDALLWGSVLVVGLWVGTWTVPGLATAVAAAPAVVVTVAALLLVGAGAVRSALVPAHRWLPETAAAPSPVSALLHAGVVNGAGVLALLMWPLLLASGVARVVLIVLGVATAIIATAHMRTRMDVKGRLAASTSSQMGYLAIQVGLGIPAAALAHIVGHGVWKAAQFLGAGDAIARARNVDAAPSRPLRTSHVIALGVLALAVVSTAAFVPLGSWLPLSAPAELLPVAVAVGIAWIALVAIDRAAVPARPRLLAAGAVLFGAAAYLVGLRGLTVLLAPELGLPAGWSEPSGVLAGIAVAGILVIAAIAFRIDSRVRAGRHTGIARRAAAASLRPLTIRERMGRRPLAAVTLAPVPAPDGERAVRDLRIGSASLARLYPLTSFVASNPLADLEDLGFAEASRVATDLWAAKPGPTAAVIRRAVADGHASEQDVAAVVDEALPAEERVVAGVALSRSGVARRLIVDDEADPARVRAAVEALRDAGLQTQRRVRTPMEAVDVPSSAQDRARDLALHVCARSMGHASWAGAAGPWTELRASEALLDALLGVKGSGDAVSGLPVDAAMALDVLVRGLGIEPADRPAFLSRLLARDPGWPGHLLWRERHALLGEQAGLPADPGPAPVGLLVEVAAARLAIEVIVASAYAATRPPYAIRVTDLVHLDVPVDVARMIAVIAPEGLDLTQASADDIRALHGLLEPLAGGGLAQLRARVLERAFRAPVLTSISGNAGNAAEPSGAASEGRPAAQLVMCIDVRSERLRRSLEAQGPWETFGAAGFFGIPVRYQAASGAVTERAPALLRPTVSATEHAQAGTGIEGVFDALVRAIRAVERTPGLVFGWAEAIGWVLAPGVLARTLWPAWARSTVTAARRRAALPTQGLLDLDAPLDDRVAAAAGFLATTGLVEFAPLVLLCGHGATVTNNPHVAAYDCGACGGAAGDVSARAMVGILNDAAVRSGLRERGIAIPSGTVFVAALHDTTTDEVRILDSAGLAASQARVLADLQADVRKAGMVVRAERLALLPDATAASRTLRTAANRGADWAQPRPEWGLAGAAAIVVGPRSLTRGLNLDGRVFLQSYRPDIDPDGALLEQLMAAPVVVAQWITSQYWASTVDPDRFGAGDKTTHNIVGDGVGLSAVVTGARSDLRLGLPWQAVSAHAPAGTREDPWSASTRHLPQRLLVVVQADRAVLDAVIGRQAGVAALLAGEWVTLCAIDPVSGAAHQRETDGSWVAVTPPMSVGDPASGRLVTTGG